MAAIKTFIEKEKQFAEAEMFADEPKLIKISDALYVPANFEDDHNYYANAEGTRRYYGTTTVLKVLNKPALIQWAANMTCDYLKEVGEAHNSKDALVITFEQLYEARSAHRKKKESAGEAGTSVHAEIEAYIHYCMEHDGFAVSLKDGLKEEVAQQTNEFVDWAVKEGVQFLASELRMCSEKLWVAGTADFVAKIKGKLFIGDIKTSSAIYPENYIQASAYAHMARSMGLYDKFHGVIIVNVPKQGGLVVKENYDLKGNFEAFKAALVLFKYLEAQTIKKLKK